MPTCVRGFFTVGQFTMRENLRLGFFFTANCPTAKNPRVAYTVAQYDSRSHYKKKGRGGEGSASQHL